MKRLFLFLFILSSFVFATAHASAAWSIPSIDVDITINADSSITVRETIIADFSREAHHGIYRHIPVRYRNAAGMWFDARITVLSIKDDKGNDWWYSSSRKGDSLYLKIGDRDRLFRDKRTYVITYLVQRGMGFFEDHDELYWNAIGDQWEVTIESAVCRVHMPPAMNSLKVNAEDVSYRAFTGPFGSRGQNYRVEMTDNFDLVFTATSPIRCGESMTVLVGLPKGVITEPGFITKAGWLLTDNWPLLVPLLAVPLLFLVWFMYGRDPRGRGTIMVQYDPPKGVTPLFAGTIIDEKLDARDITASIVHLAVKGCIRIKQTGPLTEDLLLEKLRGFEDDTSLTKCELIILRKIFEDGGSRSLKSLRNDFSRTVLTLKEKVNKELVLKGYFTRNPAKVRASFIVLALFMGLAGFFVVTTTQSFMHMLAFFLTGAMVFAVGRIMPRKTRKGVQVVEHMKGLEEFILRAEKDSIKLSERQMVFERLLPYAMTLGVESKLVDMFKDVYTENPKWFHARPGVPYSYSLFASSLAMTNRGILSTISTATRTTSFGSGVSGFSSGGGFSGGGGGGGGGGAW